MELTAFTVLVGLLCVVGVGTVIYRLVKIAKSLWRKIVFAWMLKRSGNLANDFVVNEIILLRRESQELHKDVRELLDLFAEKEDGQ